MERADDAAAMAAALGESRSVRVVSGPSYDTGRRTHNNILAFEHLPAEVTRLVLTLQVDPNLQRMDWMTAGGPTMAFHRDEAGQGPLLAVVTCIGTDYIRSPLLDGDAPLLDGGSGITAWLSERGCPHE